VYDIPRRSNIGGEIRDMVLVERALNKAQIDIVDRAECILHANPIPVFDFTGLIKGFIALEALALDNVEENVVRSTTKIDLGIELYNMEEL
jgi:hypothetical protein